MEPANQLAPPVVAVMVVHEPGEWFADVLDGLAGQDYGNLKFLFLVVGQPGDLADRIHAAVPGAFVRAVAGNPGFGAAANEVLHLVEGENGFFCFLHDDVALEPDAIRQLVEELYRSNAGIVGPKLVLWEDDQLLQHVGLGVDRFGEVDSLVDAGEVDQEQHDAVRDVFALPSACLLVRADLFRALHGFDPAIDYYFDDVDLCWRAHLGGARVVVVPAATARHVEGLVARRPDLRHADLQERHRLRMVATLTGARRLPLLLIQLAVITVFEVLASVLTGHLRRAWAEVKAFLGLLPRVPRIVSRRRVIAASRDVPDSEVAGLQLRGSARLASFLRARDNRQLARDSSTERRWRQTAGSAPSIAWLVVIAAVLFGSRQLITNGVPQVGEFLRFPKSGRGALADYMSGWWGHGLGATVAAPTSIALIGVGSVLTLFHMALWQTAAVVGLLFVGAAGMWRLATIFPTPRARITAMVAYAAVPLPSELLSVGRWSALACYAATPWVVHLLRRAVGIETFGSAELDAVEHYASVPPRRRLRLLAQLALVVAATGAFVPAFALVVAGVGLVLAITTVMARGSWRAALGLLGCTVLALGLAFVANLPWSASLLGTRGWDTVAGVAPAGSRSIGLQHLARFGLGKGPLGVLALALYLPVLIAPLVARSWRLTWAVRAGGLVVGFGWLVLLDDRGSLAMRLPEPGVMLAPVAVGLALAAACCVAALQDDVLPGSFGWRQPLGLLAVAAVVVGLLPGVLAIGGGRWNMPKRTLPEVLRQLPAKPADGDYRVLWLGDPRVLPVAAWTYRPGIGFAVTDDGALGVGDTWAGRPSSVELEITGALDAIAAETTLRAGRLLAPYGIRYVIVPVADGAISTVDHPLPLPAGLVDALDDQLDLATPLSRPLNYLVYENTAWTPTRGVLTSAGTAASQQAGGEALAQADLRGTTPFAVGSPDRGPAVGQLSQGTLHVAVPYDDHWRLTVDGTPVASRRAFGSTMAFDVATAGTGRLTYHTATARRLAVLLQAVFWLALAAVSSRLEPRTWFRRRRRGPAPDQSPMLSLEAPIAAPGGEGVPWHNGADDENEAVR